QNGGIRTIGASLDLHAGQLVDRVGVSMGLSFPAGPGLEKLAQASCGPKARLKASVEGTGCHLSGAETQLYALMKDGLCKEDAAMEVRFGGKEPDEILESLVSSQRKAFAAAAAAFEDDSPARVAALEKAAAQQRELSKAWLPLSDKLLESFRAGTTNEDEIAALSKTLRDAADGADGAADALEALSPDALDAMRGGESVACGLRAWLADPVRQLGFALEAQSNALARTASTRLVRTPVMEQGAAISLFKSFSERIEPWLDALEKAGQNDAGDGTAASVPADSLTPAAIGGAQVPLSEEDRKEVLRLTEETSGTLSLIAMGVSPESGDVLPEDQLPNARAAADNMAELLALLSKTQQNQQQQQ
ncbi:MAG: hypothetical protein IJ678_04495, partial [Kiritimatiellae bacterium]|nr:hypothetical protein [Kiritimatiellia bacterium]